MSEGDSDGPPPETATPLDERPLRKHPYLRLALWAGSFLLLTSLGVAWAVRGSDLQPGKLRALLELPGVTLTGVALLALGVLWFEMLRFRVQGWAIGERISWLACWDACVANFFFAWLTPGAALSEPATLVALRNRGVPWEVGLVVCFGKSFVSYGLIFVATIVLLGLGLGPDLHPVLLLPFVSGGIVLVGIFLVVGLGMLWPERLLAWLDRRREGLLARAWLQGERAQRAITGLHETLGKSVRKAADLRAVRAWQWLVILAAHGLYYASFVGTFLALAHAMGASSMLETTYAAVIYQAFTYVAPTPGGAGLSEGTAGAFFGHVLRPEAAVLAVLLYRSVTFYAHLAIGALYLPIVGGMRAVVERE